MSVIPEHAERFRNLESSELALIRLIEEQGAFNNQFRVSHGVSESLNQGDVPDSTRYGTFYNCREYGITYSVGEFAFCVFEHRNNDTVYIQGSRLDDSYEYGPYTGESKYDGLTTVEPEDYGTAARIVQRLLVSASESPRGASLDSVLASAGLR